MADKKYGHQRRKKAESKAFRRIVLGLAAIYGAFHPCTVTKQDDAYAEAMDFDEAITLLAKMIEGFDSDRLGCGDCSFPESNEFPETRIFDVFPLVSGATAELSSDRFQSPVRDPVRIDLDEARFRLVESFRYRHV